jgi:hypothetical protein
MTQSPPIGFQRNARTSSWSSICYTALMSRYWFLFGTFIVGFFCWMQFAYFGCDRLRTHGGRAAVFAGGYSVVNQIAARPYAGPVSDASTSQDCAEHTADIVSQLNARVCDRMVVRVHEAAQRCCRNVPSQYAPDHGLLDACRFSVAALTRRTDICAVNIDTEVAEHLVERMSLGCDEDWRWPDAWDSLLRLPGAERLHAGRACDNHGVHGDEHDCDTGLACVAPNASAGSHGFCLPQRITGERCWRRGDCAPDLFCWGDGVNETRTCLRSRGLGQSCRQTFHCGPNAYCQHDLQSEHGIRFDEVGVCATRLPLDSQCADSRDCAADLFCDRERIPHDTDIFAGRCAPLQRVLQGEPCDRTHACDVNSVCSHAGHYCEAPQGVCWPRHCVHPFAHQAPTATCDDECGA